MTSVVIDEGWRLGESKRGRVVHRDAARARNAVRARFTNGLNYYMVCTELHRFLKETCGKDYNESVRLDYEIRPVGSDEESKWVLHFDDPGKAALVKLRWGGVL